MHQGRAIARGTPAEIAASFPRRLLEVRGPDLAAAIARLHADRVPGTDARRFGDRLHLVHDDDDQAAAARARLAGLDVEVVPVAAGIEDVFVALLEEAS